MVDFHGRGNQFLVKVVYFIHNRCPAGGVPGATLRFMQIVPVQVLFEQVFKHVVLCLPEDNFSGLPCVLISSVPEPNALIYFPAYQSRGETF